MTGETVARWFRPGRRPAGRRGRFWPPWGSGALIAQMFSTVIGLALPTIKEDLALGLSAQTWTITAYSLAFGAALVAGGRMGDLVGEVKMIVVGFVIFGGGLLMSAIAVGGPLMISGRRAGHRHRYLGARHAVHRGQLVPGGPTRLCSRRGVSPMGSVCSSVRCSPPG